MWFGLKAVLGSIVNPMNPDLSLLNNREAFELKLYLLGFRKFKLCLTTDKWTDDNTVQVVLYQMGVELQTETLSTDKLST